MNLDTLQAQVEKQAAKRDGLYVALHPPVALALVLVAKAVEEHWEASDPSQPPQRQALIRSAMNMSTALASLMDALCDNAEVPK